MIGNSFPEWVFIRLSIAFLRLLAPASIVFLVACAVTRRVLGGSWLLGYAAVESGFYLLVFLPRWRSLQAPPTYSPPSQTRAQRRETFQKCCHDHQLHIIDPPYPLGWFFPHRTSPSTPLRKQDLINWLHSVFYLSEPVETDVAAKKEYEEEIGEYVQWAESNLGTSLVDDDDDGHGIKKRWWNVWRTKREPLPSMRVKQDPVNALHRPLLWYLIVTFVDTATSFQLLILGFRHFTLSSSWFTCFPPRPILAIPGASTNTHLFPDKDGVLLPWWYRPHTAGSESMPIIFLHGIGIGLHPYLPFIRSLPPNTGIIAFELLPISMHMTRTTIPPRPLMIQAINRVLESVGWERVVVVGHSYGTFLVSSMVKDMDTPAHSPIEEQSEIAPTGISPRSSPSGIETDADEDEERLLPTRFMCAAAGAQAIPTDSTTTIVTTTATISPNSTSDILALPGGSESTLLYPRTLHSTHVSLQSRFAHVVLVDPIPILLHLPDIAWNFLYREPRRASEWQLWYFASRDGDVGRQLGRGMCWGEGWLGRGEVREVMRAGGGEGEGEREGGGGRMERKGRNVAVVLAGEDQIVPTELVRRYLTGEEEARECWIGKGWGWNVGEGADGEEGTLVDVDGDIGSGGGSHEGGRKYGDLEVIWTPGLDHATVFDMAGMRKKLVDVLERYIRDI